MSKRDRSLVISFFTDSDDNKLVCSLCGYKMAVPKDMSTSTRRYHLKSKHKQSYDEMCKKEDENKIQKKKKCEEEDTRRSSLVMLKPTTSGEPSHQLTLKEAETYTRKYTPDDPAQVKSNSLLINWIADGLLPYTTVENEQFLRWTSHINRKIHVVSEKVIRTKLLPELDVKVQYEVKRILTDVIHGTQHAITTDIWSSPARESFISYTAHFISKDWTRKRVVLRCCSFDFDHSGDNISHVLRSITSDWELGDISAVVRDNASNMVKATNQELNETDNESGDENDDDIQGDEENAEMVRCHGGVNCTCHCLHLVVKHSIDKQVRSNFLRIFKNGSYWLVSIREYKNKNC